MNDLPNEVLCELFKKSCISPKEWSTLRCVCRFYKEMADEMFAWCVEEHREQFQVGGPFVSSMHVKGKKNLFKFYLKKYKEWKAIADGSKRYCSFDLQKKNLIAMEDDEWKTQRDGWLDERIAIKVTAMEVGKEWNQLGRSEWEQCTPTKDIDIILTILHKERSDLLALPFGYVHFAHPAAKADRLVYVAFPITDFRQSLGEYVGDLALQKLSASDQEKTFKEMRHFSMQMIEAARLCIDIGLPIRHVHLDGVRLRNELGSEGRRNVVLYDWWLDPSLQLWLEVATWGDPNYSSRSPRPIAGSFATPAHFRAPDHPTRQSWAIGRGLSEQHIVYSLSAITYFLHRSVTGQAEAFDERHLERYGRKRFAKYDFSLLEKDSFLEKYPPYMLEIVKSGTCKAEQRCSLLGLKRMLDGRVGRHNDRPIFE